MRIRIYQINPEKDASRSMFRSYDENRAVNPNEYDNVFDADVDCENLEQIFSQFNTTFHPLFRGRSLSVSDVVELADKGTFYYCDSIGFKEVEFDPSQTHKPDDLLKVVVVEPHKKPYIGEITKGLSGAQRVVGGYIEHIYNPDSTIIVANEEEKLNGMDGNRRIENDVNAGTFFIVGDDGEDYRSLTEDEAQKYMERFAEPDEDITPGEIEAYCGFMFVSSDFDLG